jgi:hypothetical protein
MTLEDEYGVNQIICCELIFTHQAAAEFISPHTPRAGKRIVRHDGNNWIGLRPL